MLHICIESINFSVSISVFSKASNHCQDLGSFSGSTPGQVFQDPCKPNVTIDKIEVTVGPVGQVSAMIRSLRTTYR